jgi:hypothetical protein
MRLKPVDDANSPEVSVTCSKCGRSVSSRNAFADLDGKAFESYYCHECATSPEVKTRNVYDQMVAAGIDCANHYSDLYVPVNTETRRIIDAYPFRENVTLFKSNVDGEWWFDIPFAYLPFWNRGSQA